LDLGLCVIEIFGFDNVFDGRGGGWRFFALTFKFTALLAISIALSVYLSNGDDLRVTNSSRAFDGFCIFAAMLFFFILGVVVWIGMRGLLVGNLKAYKHYANILPTIPAFVAISKAVIYGTCLYFLKTFWTNVGFVGSLVLARKGLMFLTTLVNGILGSI
jgi:hypothetical protein